MGFGYREADRFPLAIIRKFDLRPRLVVVNADGFFGGGLSEWAEVVNRDTPFARAQAAVGSRGGARGPPASCTSLVPNWFRLFGLPGLGAAARLHRLPRPRSDGTWALSPWPEGTTGFDDPPLDGPPLGARRDRRRPRLQGRTRPPRRATGTDPRAVARADARGRAGALRRAARASRWSLADVPGLTTHDNSHLSEGSAHDWTARPARRAGAAASTRPGCARPASPAP